MGVCRDNIESVLTDSEHGFFYASDARILSVVANSHLFVHVNRDQMVGAINLLARRAMRSNCLLDDRDSRPRAQTRFDSRSHSYRGSQAKKLIYGV